MNAYVKTPAPATIDAETFRALFREWAGAASIVAIGEGQARRGLVVTSLTPLSDDPASLLICVNSGASAFPAFAPGARFGVNILADDQEDVAEAFSGRTGLKDAARFSAGRWVQRPGGAPLLSGALAAIECSVDRILAHGTHGIVLAHILAAEGAGPQAGALAWWRGAWRKLGRA